jgi:general secretion pathway protein G
MRARVVPAGASSRVQTWARRGFTLVELLLAMTIMGLLAGIAMNPLHTALDRVRMIRAISEISMLQREIALFEAAKGELPATLDDVGRGGMRDPWGFPYAYVRFERKGNGGGGGGNGNGNGNGNGGGGNGGGGGIAGQARKDRFLVPINSTYDLFSVGPDGKSTGPLTASISRDDVIRANDGGYIGPASGY